MPVQSVALKGLGTVRKAMNADRFNMEIRKFLKQVGVTAQREIELAVQKALAEGRLKGTEKLNSKVRLTVPAVGLIHEVDGVIELE
jgi:Family of unknown function (DUF6494)